MRRRRNIRPRKTKRRLFAVYYVLVAVLAFAVTGAALYTVRPHVSQHTWGPLPVPVLPTVTYPGPLSMIVHEGPVLGATTFDATDIVTDVNRERLARGIKPLRISRELMQAAKARAETIMKHQNFSHQDPFDHVELGTVLPQVAYQFSYASENIGMGGGNAADFVYGFMHSESHRRNLLNPDLTDTGVAIATGPYGSWYVTVAVQIFAVPGGEQEYLGYTDSDVAAYRKRLAAIDDELNPFDWTVQALVGNPAYTQSRRQTLLHQRTILRDVYALMQKRQPLTAKTVADIRTFNMSL